MVYPTATRLRFTRFVSTTSACPLTSPVHHWVGLEGSFTVDGVEPFGNRKRGMDSEGHGEWGVCG